MNILLASAVIEATWVGQTLLTGKPKTAAKGWALGIVNMLLWIGFGIWTGGYFFTLCAGPGIVMYARNLRLARAAETRRKRLEPKHPVLGYYPWDTV